MRLHVTDEDPNNVQQKMVPGVMSKMACYKLPSIEHGYDQLNILEVQDSLDVLASGMLAGL